MKLKVLLFAALVSGIGFGEIHADSLAHVLSDLRSYLGEIKKCESVRTGMQEYENQCTNGQQALINRTRNEIGKIEAQFEAEKIALMRAHLDQLLAKVKSTDNIDALHNFLNEIRACESVRTGMQEYENQCTNGQQAFIDFARNKIDEIGKRKSSEAIARDTAQLESLMARADNLRR